MSSVGGASSIRVLATLRLNDSLRKLPTMTAIFRGAMAFLFQSVKNVNSNHFYIIVPPG